MLNGECRIMDVISMWTSCRTQCSRQAELPSSLTSSESGGQRSCESDDGKSDSDVEVTYKCPCGKQFTRSAAFRRHLDVAHSNAESHKCQECGKTFGYQRTLTMHMSVHRDTKQFTSTIERCTRTKVSQKVHKTTTTTSSSNSSNSSNNSNSNSADNDNNSNKKNSNTEEADDVSGEDGRAKMNNNVIDPGRSIKPDSDDSQSCERSPLEVAASAHSSQNSSSKDVIDSAEEFTDKENHSPPGTPPGADRLSQNEAPAKRPTRATFELDRSFPKSKPKTGNSEAVILRGDSRSVIPAKYRGGFEGKVSIITINTDNSLVSDNFIFQHGAERAGSLLVNPGTHSVIVIKTQNRNKTSPASGASLCADKLVGGGNEAARESARNTCLLGDVNSIRKSQRLQGKIPGWKQVAEEQEEADHKSKRRKMAKVKVEEMANGYDVNESEATYEEHASCRSRENEAMDDTGLAEGVQKRQRLVGSSKEPCGTVKSGVFRCVMCDRSFESEKYLSMHMSLHKVDNSMESLMQRNNKDEDVEEALAKNARTSAAAGATGGGATGGGGAYWTCKICNKVFAQNSNYKNHIRTHSDERPFVCQICSIGFKERYHLKKHMLFKHSDELKEECRYCGKKFKDSTAVRAHERIHSDVRPYSCRRCGKSFKTSECLWHHENRSKTCGQALLGMPAPSPRFKRGRQPKKDVGKAGKLAGTVAPHGGLRAATVAQQPMPGSSLLISDGLARYGYGELGGASAPSQRPCNLVPVAEPQLVKVHCTPIVTASTTAAAAKPEQVVGSYEKSSSSSSPLMTSSSSAGHAQPLSTCSTPAVAGGGCSAVLVKVEPEVALPDYELTAMASSDGSYDDNRHDVLLEEEDPGINTSAMMDPESGIADISHETILQLEEEIKKDPVLEDIELSLLEKSADDDGDDDIRIDDDVMMDDDYSDDDDDDDDDDQSDADVDVDGGYKLEAGGLTCDKCGKRFASASAFDKHLLTHAGLRPYVCAVCDVGFKLKVHLKKHHLYRHSDEKPCECSICGKKFKDSSAVRLHERIHSTDRPFHCECGKTFKTRENLWGHRHRGPCDRKVKAESCELGDVITATADVSVYPHGAAQLRGNHVTARAAVSDKQVIARAVIVNNQLTAEATIADNGEVKASAVARVASSDVIGGDVRSTSVTVGCPGRADVGNSAIFSRSQESRVSLPVLNVPSPAVSVPTAVVAPLKREVTAADVMPSASIVKPIKREPSFSDVTHVQQVSTPPKPVETPSNNNNNNNNSNNSSSSNNNNNNNKTDTSLPPFETFSPTLRSKGPSLAERCPTIQKYLQMTQQPVKLPGIQQLFQSHSMAHDPGSAGLAAHVAMVQSLLPMRCRDPSAPLGPHPARGLQSAAGHPGLASPRRSEIQTTMTSACHPCPILTHYTTPTVSSPAGHHIQNRLAPQKAGLRSTSPYPGSLPLLQHTDPSLASTYGDVLTSRSPGDQPAVTAASALSSVTWDDDKKMSSSTVWQMEQEQLFQDLTQTAGFGQL